MPNMKIYVDETLYGACREALVANLPEIRDMLCRELKVDTAACQFAVLPVIAMEDLPRVNVELMILPKPDRSRGVVLGICEKLRDRVSAATGTHVAVRAAALDPETYIALK